MDVLVKHIKDNYPEATLSGVKAGPISAAKPEPPKPKPAETKPAPGKVNSNPFG